MKVSVIIPNYNHASFLEQRIETVLSQTYQDFEVIILDDLSTDNSKIVIEKYKGHPKIVDIVYNEINSGSTFKQWYKGLMMAKGELIWIAESDDWCENNFLEVLVHGLQKNPGAVLAYSQTYCIDTTDKIWWITKANNLEEVMEGTSFIHKHLLRGTAIVNASMAIFKKEAFLRIPPDFTEFRFAGDWLFWIEIARQGDVFISGRILNFFRRHAIAISELGHSTGNNVVEHLKIIGYLKKYKLIANQLYKQLIFIKYKQYRQNEKKLDSNTLKAIKQKFIEMFATKSEAKAYLLSMQVKSLLTTFRGKQKR